MSAERKLPRPGHGLLTEQAYEQVELLFEQLLVVGEVEAEEREGVRERAAADDQLRAPVRDGVQRGEVGVQPHRVLRAENGDGVPSRIRSVRLEIAARITWPAESMNSVR